MTIPLFKGIIPPVPTILNQEGKLDKSGMGRIIDHLIASKVDVLFFLGSAGEFSQMSADMRKEVAEFCVKYTNHRLPTLIGIAAPGTEETIHFGHHAKAIGAAGTVLVNPYYAILTEENIYNYYKSVAGEVELPIILYNFPALTGQDLSPALVKRLALEFPSIVGIKDTVDSMRHIRDIILAVKPVRPDFAVYAGFDEYLLDTLIIGGDGGFPSSANFAPYLTKGIYRAFQEQDGNRLIELQKLLSYIPPIFSLESPFYSVVKEAVKMSGIDISTYVLPPAAPLTEAKKALVKEALQRIGAVQ
ncbi:dihydrodipicolinate synthase family protein [Sporomusa sp.]|uniref:dihydrodipicolinate synthase family protein n=1 Tax=Sporomusa sp. TaxID=2078658 RepID=UPI002D0260D3|nr:dihydrodipicolinate synthase family protein [Sporomusa sp.]HWR07722.1 dihydrodipicolinate synthase family protein [Sporomusa sp.]